MSEQDLARNICAALYRLFNAADLRSKVSEDDIVRESECTYDQFANCLKADGDLRELMQMTGFSKLLHDKSLVS